MEAVQIVYDLLSLIAIGYLAFYKSYFTERGKIVATKQDIKEMTEKIEGVKADIALLTHKKTIYFDEKRQSLIGYKDAYFDWLNNILYGFPIDSEVDIFQEVIKEVKKLNVECAKARSNLDLYYEDNDLEDTIAPMEELTMQLESVFIKGLNTIKMINTGIKNASNEPYASVENKTKLILLRDTHIEKFVNESSGIFNELIPILELFRKLIYEKLRIAPDNDNS